MAEVDISAIDIDRVWADDEYRRTLSDQQVEAVAATVLAEGEVSDDDLEGVSGGRRAIARLNLSRKATTSAAPICHKPICCGSHLTTR